MPCVEVPLDEAADAVEPPFRFVHQFVAAQRGQLPFHTIDQPARRRCKREDFAKGFATPAPEHAADRVGDAATRNVDATPLDRITLDDTVILSAARDLGVKSRQFTRRSLAARGMKVSTRPGATTFSAPL
jgi:hypothetical protein